MSTYKITGTITEADGSKVDFTAIDTPDYNKVIAMSGMGSVGALSTAAAVASTVAPAISFARGVSTQQPLFNVTNTANSYSNNLNVFGTSSYSGATITVFVDNVQVNTTTTDVGGGWSCGLGILSDGSHFCSATARVAGVSSPNSTNFTFTIISPISNFTSTPSTRFNLDGQYAMEVMTANTGYSLQNPDSHTIRFECRSGDNWSVSDSGSVDRCEIGGGDVGITNNVDNKPFYCTYEYILDSTVPNSSNNFCLFWQFHGNDSVSPPFAIHLGSANESAAPADHIYVEMRWWNAGRGALSQSTVVLTQLYTGPSVFTRQVWHHVDMKLLTNNNGAGIVQLWIDDVQVINYVGNFGYGAGGYPEFGWYRGTTPITETEISRVRNYQMLMSLT